MLPLYITLKRSWKWSYQLLWDLWRDQCLEIQSPPNDLHTAEDPPAIQSAAWVDLISYQLLKDLFDVPVHSAKHTQVQVAVVVQGSQGSCHYYFHLLLHYGLNIHQIDHKKQKFATREEGAIICTSVRADGRGWKAKGKQLPTFKILNLILWKNQVSLRSHFLRKTSKQSCCCTLVRSYRTHLKKYYNKS